MTGLPASSTIRLPADGPHRSPSRRSPTGLARLGLLAAVVLAVAACGSSSSANGTGDGETAGRGGSAVAPAPAGPASVPDQAPGGAAPATDESTALVTGPLIVRTGQLSLEVASLDDALAAADRAVTAAGGYIAGSQRQGDGETASATVTFRIPADRWEPTLAALRGVGRKVLGEQTASQEVTSQVVDLGARLVNLRATEAALQAIMARATRIPDILEVQSQLTGVRQQIEELTAQQQTLQKQAALGTLTVAFSLPPVVAVTQVREGWDPAGDVDRAVATLVGLGQGVASAAIWVAIVLLPLALVLAAGLGAAWLVVRRVRPRPAPPAPGAPLDAPAA